MIKVARFSWEWLRSFWWRSDRAHHGGWILWRWWSGWYCNGLPQLLRYTFCGILEASLWLCLFFFVGLLRSSRSMFRASLPWTFWAFIGRGDSGFLTWSSYRPFGSLSFHCLGTKIIRGLLLFRSCNGDKVSFSFRAHCWCHMSSLWPQKGLVPRRLDTLVLGRWGCKWGESY